jgi:hypothetical protein
VRREVRGKNSSGMEDVRSSIRRAISAAWKAFISDDVMTSNGDGSGQVVDGALKRDEHSMQTHIVPESVQPSPLREIVFVRDATITPPTRTTLAVGGETLRRLAALGLTLVVACAAFAGIFAATRPTVYGAQADVVYDPANPATSSAQLDRELATQKTIVEGHVVLAAVAADAGVPLVELERNAAAKLLAGTNVFRLTVGNRRRARARAVVRSWAQTYVDVQRGSLSSGAERRVGELTTELRSTRKQADTARELGRFPEADGLDARAKDLKGRIVDERQRAAEDHSTAARVISPAYVLPSPLAPHPIQASAAGALVGAILAAVLIFVRLARRTE